jgi:hypothetical protein
MGLAAAVVFLSESILGGCLGFARCPDRLD